MSKSFSPANQSILIVRAKVCVVNSALKRAASGYCTLIWRIVCIYSLLVKKFLIGDIFLLGKLVKRILRL